jgi:hypothetical protein
VRLIEKSTGFLPCPLFVSPIRKLVTHHRKGIGPYLGIPQQFNGTPDGLQHFFQAFLTRGYWQLLPPEKNRLAADERR